MKMYPDGSRVVLTGRTLRVVDATRFVAVEELDMNSVFGGVGFSPDGGRLFACLPDRQAVLAFDLQPGDCASPSAGLEGFWPGDGTAEDAYDGAPGIPGEGVDFAPGHAGRAFRLDGKRGYIRVERDKAAITSREGTAAAWVKFASLGAEMTIVDAMRPRGGAGWRLFKNGLNRFEFCLSGGTGCLTSNTPVAAGRWYHVAAQRSANGVALYVNGRVEGSKPLAQPLPINPVNAVGMNFGASQEPKRFLDGLIDEVVVFSRALSPAEMQKLFENAGCSAN